MFPIYIMAQNRLLTLPRKTAEVSFELSAISMERNTTGDLERTWTLNDLFRPNLCKR